MQTPRAPPPPVAAMLSPILWQLNNPDRFDMYSVGVLLLQAAMPALRTDSALINFRRKLEQCKYDLGEWRRQQVRCPGKPPAMLSPAKVRVQVRNLLS